MVTMYGMSKRFGLIGLETIENQYLDGRRALQCSEVFAAKIDEEVMTILKDAYEEAKSLLSENRTVLDNISAFLIEKETITGKEFMEIYRKEKGLPNPEEKKEEEPKAEEPGAEEVVSDSPKEEDSNLEESLQEDTEEPKETENV